MSIKQNGGVFGRNPTFNDVTIEGQLTFDGDIDINSDLKVDGNLEVDGAATIDQDATALAFKVTGGNGGVNLAEFSRDIGVDATVGINGNAGDPQIYFESTGNTFAIGVNSNNFEISDNASIGTNTRLSISNTGNVSVSTGNLVIGTSGKGIDFSATAGTGTSELFDDYEEGTWTPYIKFAGANNVGIVYVTQTGNYTKIGNLVQISYKVQLSSKGAQTGTATIANLPFAGNGEASIMPVFFTNLSLTGEQIPIGRVAGSTTVELRTQSSGDVASMTDSNIENNSDIRMSGSYLT
jgi:hypothetical protein